MKKRWRSRKNSETVHEIPSSPDDYADGVSKYMEFHQLEPTEIGEMSFDIPETIVCVGSAQWVAYRSDKWTNKNENYIHEHEYGVKCYHADATEDEGDECDVPEWIYAAKTLVRLGDCLGYLYIGADGEPCEAMVEKPYPELYCTPDGNALIVVEDKCRLVALIWGGNLGVTARGIVG